MLPNVDRAGVRLAEEHGLQSVNKVMTRTIVNAARKGWDVYTNSEFCAFYPAVVTFHCRNVRIWKPQPCLFERGMIFCSVIFVLSSSVMFPSPFCYYLKQLTGCLLAPRLMTSPPFSSSHSSCSFAPVTPYQAPIIIIHLQHHHPHLPPHHLHR